MKTGCESDRLPIAAQPDRGSEKYRGDCQPDPQTGAAQEFLRAEVRHRAHRESTWTWQLEDFRTHETVLQQGGEMGRVKSNPFDRADGEQR